MDIAAIWQDVSPKVIVIDRKLALMNAIPVIFPGCKNILCSWHVNKNLLAKCREHFFLNDEQWAEFMREWKYLVYCKSVALNRRALVNFIYKYNQSYTQLFDIYCKNVDSFPGVFHGFLYQQYFPFWHHVHFSR